MAPIYPDLSCKIFLNLALETAYAKSWLNNQLNAIEFFGIISLTGQNSNNIVYDMVYLSTEYLRSIISILLFFRALR
jgi:hypothetical protein